LTINNIISHFQVSLCPLLKHPIYDVPDNIDFYKTAVVGYPSGDKRMVFQQMEALTGWGTCDPDRFLAFSSLLNDLHIVATILLF
jgi:hypothetical protein